MYTFPIDLLRPGGFQATLANTRVDGGNSLNGIGQDADWSGGGYWVQKLTNIRISTDAQHLEWIGLCTEIGDGYTQVVMPELISDGMKPIGTATADTMSFKANAAANLSATLIDIKTLVGGRPARGMRFTIVHPTAGARKYSIFSATDQGGGVTRCKIRPPLREAVSADAVVDFNNVRLIMFVKSTASDLWPDLSPPYNARPQLLCVEDFSYQDGLA